MGLRPTRAAMKISYGADGAGASKGRNSEWYWRVRAEFDQRGVAVPRIVAASTQDRLTI
jgi:hypothetical protein